MDKIKRKNLRELVFSKQLENVSIAETISDSLGFQMPKSWVKEIKSVKLANHTKAYKEDECPFGDYVGKKFSEVPLKELVSYYNNGVLSKAEQCRYPSRHFWAKVHDALHFREDEILKAIKSKVRTSLQYTRSGYLKESYYCS